MQPRTTRVNPSEETINIGPLGIRFLLTGDDSGGSVSVFEVFVPVGQKLAAPAHKNDAYEEVLYGVKGVLTWTVDGTPVEVGPGQALCIPEARYIASTTSDDGRLPASWHDVGAAPAC